MTEIVVHYYFYRPGVEFDCPYCHSVQGWSGEGRLIDGHPQPNPHVVVFRHLRKCPSLLRGEPYKVDAVIHPVVKD